MLDAHPAHVLAYPSAPMIDWWMGDDRHMNGLFKLSQTYNFLKNFDQPRPGPLRNRIAFWDSIIAHPDYDTFWQSRAIWKHAKNVKPAVVARRLEPRRLPHLRRVQQRQRHREVLPRLHWCADVPLPAQGRLPRGTVRRRADVRSRHQSLAPLRRLATENAQPRTLYLRAGERVSFDPPTDRDGSVSDCYVSDPSRPVPYAMGVTFGFNAMYPTEDQRFASRRPDVLVSRSPVLTDDVTVAGPISALLHVASTGTDADFVVKLIDQYPNDAPPEYEGGPRLDAFERLVRPGVARARWRQGAERSVPLVANVADTVRVPLDDVLHTFRRGHRIVVQVQSTWYPAVDRNPQRFVPDIYQAKDADFQTASMTVFRSTARPSHLTLSILP